MLKEIKEKEFNRINGMIDSYTTDINDLVQQAEKVDEKYRKLAEKEKKDITEALEYYRNLRDELVTRRDSLGLDAAVVNKKTTAKKLKEAEEKEQVTDILFPENNEVPVIEVAGTPLDELMEEPEPESVQEETSEATPVVEDVWESAETPPEFDGAGFTEEDNNPIEEKKEDEDEDDDWPDQVEEWK